MILGEIKEIKEREERHPEKTDTILEKNFS